MPPDRAVLAVESIQVTVKGDPHVAESIVVLAPAGESGELGAGNPGAVSAG